MKFRHFLIIAVFLLAGWFWSVIWFLIFRDSETPVDLRIDAHYFAFVLFAYYVLHKLDKLEQK